MVEGEWSTEIELLRNRGVVLAPSMTAEEIRYAEEFHGFRFPPDLRAFLAVALPVSPRFPNWRSPGASELREQLAWPFEGMAFDIQNNSFWWERWGPRPQELWHALRVARAAVENAPRLIPICGHRYLPAEPEASGNPVFSVYQTDIIYYGADLRRYFACEFGSIEYAEAVRGELRRIRFWSDLVDEQG